MLASPGTRRLGGTTSLARALSVLKVVAENGTIRADAIAEELRMPISTVYRYLGTLRDFDLVVGANEEFAPGPALATMYPPNISRAALVKLVEPLLEWLVSQTEETAEASVRVGSYAVCICQRESPHQIRLTFRVGQVLPLYAGAGSRVLLALSPNEILEEVMERGLAPFTNNTPTAETLPARLTSARLTGIATSRGEYQTNAVAIATPVFYEGRVVCSLTVAGPSARCTPAWQTKAKSSLREARARLEAQI